MSFDRIGPYNLTRSDLVAASMVISFSTAAAPVRVKSVLIFLLALTMIVASLALGELQTAGLILFVVVLILIILPALRSRKRSREIYLECSPEGIIAETPEMRTTYKWSTIGTVKKVGSRLFIMISDGCALVVPDRSTTRDNLERLVATLSQERTLTTG